MTQMGLDIEAIEHLDFDSDLPCDYNRNHSTNPPCSKAAEWKIMVSCCGGMVLLCDEHYDFTGEIIAKHPAIRCSLCRFIHMPSRNIILSIDRLDK